MSVLFLSLQCAHFTTVSALSNMIVFVFEVCHLDLAKASSGSTGCLCVVSQIYFCVCVMHSQGGTC